MKYKGQLAETSRFLKENDHFLVANHLNPDGDATGSLIAMGYILESMGKRFALVNEGPTPKKFLLAVPSPFPIVDLSRERLAEAYRRAIALDCGDKARLGGVVDYFAPDVQILNIDHHATNDHFGSVNLIRPDACATAEILYDLVVYMGMPLTKRLASALYMGMLTDTGGFRYSNTTPEAMEKVSTLLKAGAEPGPIADRCLETITRSHIDLLQRTLPTLTMHHEDRVAFLSITTEARDQSKAAKEDMEQIVNYARNIEGVEVGVLFKQIDEQTVKVSLRSRECVDVSEIAKAFGGGGHARAAGCVVRESLEKAREMVLEKIKLFWR